MVSEGGGRRIRAHWFHILLALADGDSHGSGIVRHVLDQTEGSLRLWPATLYGSLEEMVEEGLIEERTGEDHPEGESGRRRYYGMTPLGRQVLRQEAVRLASLAGEALDRLSRA